jgi:hypothetical protein
MDKSSLILKRDGLGRVRTPQVPTPKRPRKLVNNYFILKCSSGASNGRYFNPGVAAGTGWYPECCSNEPASNQENEKDFANSL